MAYHGEIVGGKSQDHCVALSYTGSGTGLEQKHGEYTVGAHGGQGNHLLRGRWKSQAVLSLCKAGGCGTGRDGESAEACLSGIGQYDDEYVGEKECTE